MARESIEVAIQILHINLDVGSGLSTVNKHRNAMTMGNGNHLLDRIDRSQHIRHMSESDKACTVAEQVLIGLHIHLTAIVDGHDTQGHSLALPDELPGHDIAVMFHHSDDNFITVLQHLAERRCHEVDALGGATSENHLLDAAGIDEATHLFTRLLHEICRFLREGVDATVHIGLVVVVHPVNGLHNGTRRLGRRSIVEIDERAALNLALQDGIILTYLVDVHISLFPVVSFQLSVFRRQLLTPHF